MNRIARKGASKISLATGRRVAIRRASVAPVENPTTTTGRPPAVAASASKAASAEASHSAHVEPGMTGPGPSCPARTGETTRTPAPSSPSTRGRIS